MKTFIVVAFALNLLTGCAHESARNNMGFESFDRIPAERELQLVIAVLQQGNENTQFRYFCSSAVSVHFRNWDLDPKLGHQLRDASIDQIREWSLLLSRYAQARHCWQGSDKEKETVLSAGKQLLTMFDKLEVYNLGSSWGEAGAKLDPEGRAFHVR